MNPFERPHLDCQVPACLPAYPEQLADKTTGNIVSRTAGRIQADDGDRLSFVSGHHQISCSSITNTYAVPQLSYPPPLPPMSRFD